MHSKAEYVRMQSRIREIGVRLQGLEEEREALAEERRRLGAGLEGLWPSEVGKNSEPMRSRARHPAASETLAAVIRNGVPNPDPDA